MTEKLQSILEAEGLSALLGKFNEQGVTDSILGDLTDSDLKELGIDKLGERKRLLSAFEQSTSSLAIDVNDQTQRRAVASRQEDFIYDAENGEIVIKSFRGKGHVIIPDKFDDLPLPVRIIGEGAFANNQLLLSVQIPEGITTIRASAFASCTSLASISIPKSLHTIDMCNSGVGSDGRPPFEGCTSLASIMVDPESSLFSSIDGALFDKDVSELIWMPRGKKGHFNLPETVQSLGKGAFDRCEQMAGITLPHALIELPRHAFSHCKTLAHVTLPTNLRTIGSFAFIGCTNLIDIGLPNGLTTIDGFAFRDCTSLQSAHIPGGVTSIGSYAFAGCTTLTDVKLPNSLSDIASGLFQECTNLKTITIPSSVEAIDSSAFKGCTSLESIILPESVVKVGSSAFAGCINLKEIILPSGFCFIDRYAFEFSGDEIPLDRPTIPRDTFRTVAPRLCNWGEPPKSAACVASASKNQSNPSHKRSFFKFWSGS